MSSLLINLPELYNSYKSWLSKNPQLASEYESSIRLASYFIAGRINNSYAVSELVYCLSNLLVLLNDRIINKCRKLELPSSGENLKLWLTVVEYSEVFFELSAHKIWGKAGKWLIIVAIQVFKCISRLLLIYHHKEGIIQNPPVQKIERKKLHKVNDLNGAGDLDPVQSQFETSFRLKRSGRVVRKIDASPPIGIRTWKPVTKFTTICENEETIEQALSGKQLIAETLYIVKPIVHLAAMGSFGTRSWKPYLMALAMDMTSLHLYKSYNKSKVNSLTQKQKLHLSKRTVLLLLYLIRSPFYETHSSDKIQALLVALSKNLPLAKFICNPLLEYLPFWQSNYFYMWST